MSDVLLVAILRGVAPGEVVAVGRVLYARGLRTLEVPLNSPEPYVSIARLRADLPDDCRVGAGTVLTPDEVHAARDAGSQLVVSPNTDEAVVRAARAAGLDAYPGAATPTEAFRAIAAGATGVKVFPAEVVGPAGVRAWRAVVAPEVDLLPVGGIDARSIPPFLAAGATGFGVGSSLYRPGIGLADLDTRAAELVSAVQQTGRDVR